MSLLQTAKDAGMGMLGTLDGTSWVAANVFEALASTSLALSIGFRCRHLHLGGFLTWSFSLRLQQGPKITLPVVALLVPNAQQRISHWIQPQDVVEVTESFVLETKTCKT